MPAGSGNNRRENLNAKESTDRLAKVCHFLEDIVVDLSVCLGCNNLGAKFQPDGDKTASLERSINPCQETSVVFKF